MEDAPPSTTVPPAAPRAMTSRVRWRAGMEPGVRFAWLTGAILILIAVVLVGFAVAEWHHQRFLTTQGVKVQAVIIQANEWTVPGKKQPSDAPIILRFDWHGKPYETKPQPLAGWSEIITVGSVLPICVDPENPEDWTTLQHADPLGPRLVGAAVAAAIGVLTLLVAMILWKRVLNLWKDGIALETLVLDSHISALAPLSRAVRCTPADDSDSRVLTVFVPPAQGKVKSGETLWVLCVAPKARRGLAADWFV